MDMASKNAGATMTPRVSRSKNQEPSKFAENFNPNVSHHHHRQQQQQSPGPKPLFSNNPCSPSPSPSPSPVVSKSCSSKKSQKPKNHPSPVAYSPRTKIRQRKFVVAKKKQKEEEEKEGGEGEGAAAVAGGSTVSFCKCKEKKGSDGNKSKCLCVAYNNLRKSQEEFFKKRLDEEEEEEAGTESVLQEEEEEEEELGNSVVSGSESVSELGSLIVKRRRERMMEKARENVPQSGSGKVMHLVKAFEKLLSVTTSKDDEDQKEEKEPQEKNDKVMKWQLPGLQLNTTASETEASGSDFCPSNLILTSQNLGLDPHASVSSSWDSSRGRCSVSSRTSNGGRRSRRNSQESSSTFGGRRWRKKQQKVTSLKPFKLRTEQRGKLKEEEFVKKMQEMMTEEEKQRVPVAQGLPWTTDEPECLVKPPVKGSTIPIDLKLHSDVRALDRAEFDHQVAEKLSLIEQYKMERERQQKLQEEEEVRRLRKELVPKAQPMPYFDRPFIPRRSMKNPTMPREPKFHKKIKCSLSSWNEMSLNSSYID